MSDYPDKETIDSLLEFAAHAVQARLSVYRLKVCVLRTDWLLSAGNQNVHIGDNP